MKNAISSSIILSSGCDKGTKIIFFLKAIPHLKNFSATIINNISSRLGITPEHLTILIDFVSKEGNLYGN